MRRAAYILATTLAVASVSLATYGIYVLLAHPCHTVCVLRAAGWET